MTKFFLFLLGTGFFFYIQAQNAPIAGELLWQIDTKAPSYGSGAIGDIDGDGKPEVVFGTYYNDSHLYALNGENGSILWKFLSDGGPLDASVLIEDMNQDKIPEVIFGDSAYGTLSCLNGKGEVLWKFKSQSGTDSPVAATDLESDGSVELIYGTMKAEGKEGHVNVLQGSTGKLLWTAKVPGHIQSEPGIIDVNEDQVLDVLVTNWMGDGKLRALDGRNGSLLWAFETNDWIYHGVSFYDFQHDSSLEIVVADRKGNVWMLNAKTGQPLWKTTLQGEMDGSVFAPTSLVDINQDQCPEIVVCGHHLHLLDVTGKVLWRKELGGRSIARGVAVSDTNGDNASDLVFGHDGTLYVVRADTGADIWSKKLRFGTHWGEDIDHAPLITDLDGDGFLDIFVVIGKGFSDETQAQNYGRAIALRAGAGKASSANWLRFRGNPRHQGTPFVPKKQRF